MKKKQRAWLIIGWISVSIIVIALLAFKEFSSLKAELDSKATSLHSLISQRADQHDAHLTGLSALASANEEPLADMMLNLSETIRKFYSRIQYVDLIKLDKTNPYPIFTTRDTRLTKNQIVAINDAAYASDGRLQIVPSAGGYFLIKRSPNSNQALYGLALFIDAQKLLENDFNLDPHTQLVLKTGLNALIYTTPALGKQDFFTQEIQYIKTLGSQSQPLSLEITQYIHATDYIPWQFVVPLIFLSVVGFILTKSYFNQKHKTRMAEERALLGEHEARIAQASRINGLGEMASGLAHEITQPLTAILSQSQAGTRLIDANSDDTETVKQVLANISKQAKRGGDIVQRLRTWTTHTKESVKLFDLNSVAEGIRDLMKADLNERGIKIETALHPEPIQIEADHVAIEQVIFNLSRNGVDAMDGNTSGLLNLTTFTDGNYAVISVRDNGSGIPEEDLINLYQPFFTTKENGMGLGLSLCENIVNRYNGHIEIMNNAEGGVTSIVKLPVAKSGGNI
jgi:signal transduction histidine kinase